MKILSIFFTGTGGTATFQKLIQHSCRHYDIRFIELDISMSTLKISQLALKTYDVFLIGGPIYFSDYPQRLNDFVRSTFIKSEPNQKVILYSTSVYAEPVAINKLANYLNSRGYTVSDVVSVKALNNFYFSPKISPTKLNKKEAVIEDYLEKSRLIKETIVKNSYDVKIKKTLNFRNILPFIKFFLIKKHIIAKQSYFNFSVKDNCGECRLCVDNCPSKNIRIYNDVPVFKNQCYSCLKCLHNCPNNSILFNGLRIDQIKQITLDDFLD